MRRRGGGIPWWAWLVGLLLLGLLAWLLLNNLGNNGNDNGTSGTNGGGTAAQSQAAGAGAGAGASAGNGGAAGAAASGAAGNAGGGSAGAITDVAEVTGATDAASVAGREAAIEGATVQSVTGDVTFWVGESAEERVFVRMDEEASGGEQGIKVREGQTLRITGQVEEVPTDTAAWDLAEEDAAALGEAPVYISASKVEVAE